MLIKEPQSNLFFPFWNFLCARFIIKSRIQYWFLGGQGGSNASSKLSLNHHSTGISKVPKYSDKEKVFSKVMSTKVEKPPTLNFWVNHKNNRNRKIRQFIFFSFPFNTNSFMGLRVWVVTGLHNKLGLSFTSTQTKSRFSSKSSQFAEQDKCSLSFEDNQANFKWKRKLSMLQKHIGFKIEIKVSFCEMFPQRNRNFEVVCAKKIVQNRLKSKC